MKIEHKVNPVHKRVYPKIEDQLDLIYKGFLELHESGQKLPPSHKEFVELIKGIKEKYPKSS